MLPRIRTAYRVGHKSLRIKEVSHFVNMNTIYDRTTSHAAEDPAAEATERAFDQ